MPVTYQLDHNRAAGPGRQPATQARRQPAIPAAVASALPRRGQGAASFRSPARRDPSVPRMDPEARPALDAQTSAAVGRSNLRSLSPAAMAAVVAGATVRLARPGEILLGEGDRQPHLELVVDGLVRVYVVAPDGRSLTVRYVRPGGLVGAVSLYAPAFVLPATIQAIVETRLLALSPDAVRRSVDAHPDVGARPADRARRASPGVHRRDPRGVRLPPSASAWRVGCWTGGRGRPRPGGGGPDQPAAAGRRVPNGAGRGRA
jgi:Cyclic nucleotide-binding domain